MSGYCTDCGNIMCLCDYVSDDNLSLTKAIQRAHGITAKDINSYIDALEKQIASLKDRLADQVVQVLAYKVLVSELDEEIASLKEQLEREQDCVDFYANGENWSYVNQYNKTLMKMDKDIEWISPGVLLDKFAGKLARATQTRRDK